MVNRPKIIPVILSGGAGARLWPVSRAKSPKQFQSFGGGPSLFQQTLSRCHSPLFDDRPIIVSGLEHRGVLLETLQALNVKADIVLEPCRRNSCAAVLAGALLAFERDPEAIVLALAIDHHIPDQEAFRSSVRLAVEAAQQGEIVTFGVKPQFAATGYGYILPQQNQQSNIVTPVQRFAEKPDVDTAQRYLAEGYLWNSGNLLFRADIFIDEVRDLAPLVFAAVTQSIRDAQRDPDFTRLSETAFSGGPSVSVDVAIIEKTKRAAVLPVTYSWSDIGSWDAIATTLPLDENNNSITGQGMIVAGRNVVVQSDSSMTTVVGCDDLIVITTTDAVLIVRRGFSENVKELTELLRQSGKDIFL